MCRVTRKAPNIPSNTAKLPDVAAALASALSVVAVVSASLPSPQAMEVWRAACHLSPNAREAQRAVI